MSSETAKLFAQAAAKGGSGKWLASSRSLPDLGIQLLCVMEYSNQDDKDASMEKPCAGSAKRGSGKWLAPSRSSPNLGGPPRGDTLCVLGKECRSRRRLQTAAGEAGVPEANLAALKGECSWPSLALHVSVCSFSKLTAVKTNSISLCFAQ